MIRPFIYLFETPRKKYFYDVNSNAIVRIPDKIFEVLKNQMQFGDSDINSYKEIETLVQAGFLGDKHWKKIEHPATLLLEEKLNGSIEMLTLQVTQQCNLRCKYCPYSGSYYNRKHSNANMNFETARKAIDFYIKHSFDMRNLNIGFYGGEPLIQYDLIKELVAYTYQCGVGKNVNFHMTTNATLLTNESIRFLAENKFKLTISLDGPKEYHDKNRENIDEKGSFDKVIKNVQSIQEQYPKYMKEVMFNCVVDGKGDFGCLSDFFTNFELVKDFHTTFNELAQEGIKEKEILVSNEKYDNAYQYEVFKLLLSKCKLISEKEVSVIVRSYYDHLRQALKGRSIGALYNEKGHPGGPCVPGVHKLFANIHGDFYPCEKLNECISDFVIGDIERGFKYDQIEKILNVGKMTSEECKDCWCSRFCYQCILFAEDGDAVSADMRKTHCKSVKSASLNMFKDYCLIKEMETEKNDIYFL